MRIKSDNPSFDRDMSSMGLINKDVNEYHSYMHRREALLHQKSKAQNVIRDVEELKNDMQEIKSLLHELIRK